MIDTVEWAYYYDSKAARKLGISVMLVRKLVDHKLLRGEIIQRNNGSTFYVVNKDDVQTFDLGKWLA